MQEDFLGQVQKVCDDFIFPLSLYLLYLQTESKQYSFHIRHIITTRRWNILPLLATFSGRRKNNNLRRTYSETLEKCLCGISFSQIRSVTSCNQLQVRGIQLLLIQACAIWRCAWWQSWWHIIQKKKKDWKPEQNQGSQWRERGK